MTSTAWVGVTDLVIAAAVVLLIAVVWSVWRTRPSDTTDLRRDSARQDAAPAIAGLDAKLGRSRRAFGERLAGLFGRGIDSGTWESLEETLIAADVGVSATTAIVDAVRERRPVDGDEARSAVAAEMTAAFGQHDRALSLVGSPAIVIVVGVNGSGKTTTIAKLAARLKDEGKTVLLAAADTFRAAATEQLSMWADRLGVPIVKGHEGADPASVAHDAVSSAAAKAIDVVIVDTAGRLHSKTNLMQELEKVVRVLRREGTVSEVLLVIDGNTGQNGLAQARTFSEAVGVTGVAITKLDGTARGGIALAVEHELGVPIKFIGVGEGMNDLVPFEPDAFVAAIVGE